MNNLDLLTSDNKQIIERIKSRRKKLRFVSKELKKHFIGIDFMVDSVIRAVEPWYCLPELLTRVTIINLFGPTGVGKTDLVRRLVKLLQFQDRFCEIEMMNKGNSATHPWHNSIASILSTNPKIESSQPCILLLDEIQNFRTINEDGHELQEYKYRDIWTLLSDGKLPFHLELDYLFQLLWEFNEKEKREAENKSGKNPLHKLSFKGKILKADDEFSIFPEKGVSDSEDDEDNTVENEDGEGGDEEPEEPGDEHGNISMRVAERPDFLEDEKDSYYSLKHFKTMLRLTEPIEEIATWSTEKKKAVLIQKINEQSLYEEVDYTRALIFISGNIDEAYEFAKKTNEVDVDADIFNKMSMKINILDIKKALSDRFKPEQIARFGNMHIIYPTLSKSSYKTIIQRKTQEVIDNVKKRCDIKIDVDKSIHDLIYENGVFPTQGTRPVFSTISEILESPLPSFLLNAFSKKAKNIHLYYEKGNIKAKIAGNILKYPYQGTLDKLRNERNKNLDRQVLNAVHEAGHAVVYAVLFHSSPPQVSARPVSTEVSGFVWIHEICGSKAMIENKICSVLAGGVAEKIVFGKQNATWGSQEDIHEATKMAGSMIKRYGMEDFSSFIMHPQRSDIVNTDLNGANQLIENIMIKFSLKSESLLQEHRSLFNETVDFLSDNKELSPEDFKKICAKHGIKIGLKKSEETLYSDYHHQYQKFKNLKIS